MQKVGIMQKVFEIGDDSIFTPVHIMIFDGNPVGPEL